MAKQNTLNLKLAIGSLIILVIGNIGGFMFGYGQVCQRLEDLKCRVERIERLMDKVNAQVIPTGGFIK